MTVEGTVARQADQGQGENSAARMKFAAALRELLNKLELEGRRMPAEPGFHRFASKYG